MVKIKYKERLPGWWVQYSAPANQWEVYRNLDGSLGLIFRRHGDNLWTAQSVKGYGDVHVGPTTLDDAIVFARLYLSRL